MKIILKRCKLILLTFGVVYGLMAQDAVISAGNSTSSPEGSVSYTVGQVAFKNNSNTSGSVLEGVQQPYEIFITSGKEIEGIDLEISTYPNPTTDYITLKIDSEQTDLSFQLFHINGNLIHQDKVLENLTNIEVEGLKAGTYILHIIQDKKTLKTFKIIKN